MDLGDAIRKLRKERVKIDEIITALEELRLREAARAAAPKPALQRRGRKSMGEEEREAVASMMKAYWAARRASKQKIEPRKRS